MHEVFPSWLATWRTGIAQFFNRPRRATPSLKRILARPEHSIPFLMHLPHEGSTLSQIILLLEHWKQPVVQHHQQVPPTQLGVTTSARRYSEAMYFTSFLFGAVLLGARHGYNGSTQIRKPSYAEPKVAEHAKQQAVH